MSRAHNIALLDDHRMFLDGLTLLFSGHCERYSVDAYDNAADLIKAMKTGAKYDLVVSDLIMKDMNGLAFISELRTHNKSLPVLMLSGINSPPPVKEIIKLGANGFVHKSADNETLLGAVDTVIAGKTYFPEDMLSGQTDFTQSEEFAHEPDHIPTLSPRQIEVLQLIADGASNKQISDTMFISENTVKSHLKTIFFEMRVNKRTACVRKARTLGLI